MGARVAVDARHALSRSLLRLLLAAGLLLGAVGAQAGVLRYCDTPTELDATQQDRLLRFAAIVKTALADSGASVAVVARSGLDLDRFGQRYSHAGLSLRDSEHGAWAVRQLYFDCEARRPRVFDQGFAGFLYGSADPALGYLSVLLLPAPAAAPVQGAALDRALALRLLGGRYSANAYAFDDRYQNCNQWVAELLAVAWGGLVSTPPPPPAPAPDPLRRDAQRWLRAQGFEPVVFDAGLQLVSEAVALLPWLHAEDHPADDRARARFRVSMPSSIEALVQATVPGAQRLEFCHAGARVVVRRGWAPIDAGCVARAGDTEITLD